MHAENVTAARPDAPVAAADANFRSAGPAALRLMLQAARRDTLATFAAYESALTEHKLAVPYSPDLNPPLWELGHVGWFQAHWLARNAERHCGAQANPQAPRLPLRQASLVAGADAWYDSSQVPHDTRWQLPLPGAQATRAALAATLDESLALLQDCADLAHAADPHARNTVLYFHRLCLAHEDMHHEAAVYMAQALGIHLPDPRLQHRELPPPGPALQGPAQSCTLGAARPEGFAFDNECGTQQHTLPERSIDNQVLRWRDYLPFVEDGGYASARWWPGRAAVWRAALQQSTSGQAAPRYLRRAGAHWQQWRHGRWQPLNLDQAACHLTAFEADAWCRWAGRRLPTEAEWEQAARSPPGLFNWGAVWEWTVSSFEPYEGFVAHPYRDYSAPWFGSRRVLRGASLATPLRLRDVRYRNFYPPERNDIFAGFRSCAL